MAGPSLCCLCRICFWPLYSGWLRLGVPPNRRTRVVIPDVSWLLSNRPCHAIERKCGARGQPKPDEGEQSDLEAVELEPRSLGDFWLIPE